VTIHEFRPHKKYPWFCADCGYAPHEPLKHPQVDDMTTEHTERCISCDTSFLKGDKYYPDADGGSICFACAGDGPFIDLNTDETLNHKPEPLTWSDDT
jgi:hypothetical protein